MTSPTHLQDPLDELIVHMGEGDRGVNGDAARLALLKVDIRSLSVQPDAHRLQLTGQDLECGEGGKRGLARVIEFR